MATSYYPTQRRSLRLLRSAEAGTKGDVRINLAILHEVMGAVGLTNNRISLTEAEKATDRELVAMGVAGAVIGPQ